MLRKLIVFLLLIIISVTTNADDSQTKDRSCCGDGGIVYGDKWAFLVSAPSGWSMTTESDLPVNVAFFQTKKNEKSTKTPAFMYITVYERNSDAPNLDQFITNDENNFRAESSDLKVTKNNLPTIKNKNVSIRQFDNTRDKRSELIAYQEYEDWFFTIVLSAPLENELTSKKNDFVKLLDSFHPMLKKD